MPNSFTTSPAAPASPTLHSYTLAELKLVIHNAIEKELNRQVTDHVKIINDAVNRLWMSHEWSWRRKAAKLSLVAGQPYVDLPDDFGQLLDIQPASGGNSLRIVMPDELLSCRKTSGVGSGDFVVSVVGLQQPTDSDYPKYRLELCPTPSSDENNAIAIYYHAIPRAMKLDSDVVNIPAWMLPVLKQAIRAEACWDTYHEKAEAQEARLVTMLGDARNADGLLTPTLGKIRSMHDSTPVVTSVNITFT